MNGDLTDYRARNLPGAVVEQLEIHWRWLALWDAQSLRRGDCRGNFRRLNLAGADLSGLDLRYAPFDCADLSGASLRGANCYRAKFRRANLDGADLREADFRGAEMAGSSICNANFDGTQFWCHSIGGAGGYITALTADEWALIRDRRAAQQSTRG